MTTEKDRKNMLSLNEAAAELGISRDTVRRLIADGRLLALRFAPRCIRIRRKDLEVFVERSVTA